MSSTETIYIPEEYLPAIDELPGNLRKIAAAIEEDIPGNGVRLTLLLAQRFPNIPLYFRSAKEFIDEYLDNRMRAEYDRGGVTALDLAIKRRMGLRTVERKLAQPATKKELDERQIRMF